MLDLISEAHSQMATDEDTPDTLEDELDMNLTSITKELKLLELENERITNEQSMLETILRQNEDSEVLAKYMKLVNEKNGLVRRQMQLNILEKEVTLDKRQAIIKKELQVTIIPIHTTVS